MSSPAPGSRLALNCGCSRSASAAAFRRKLVRVSVMPCCFAVSKLRVTMVLRSVTSALSKCVTWGMRAADSAMRSAMVRRRCESGWRSTGPHCSNFGSGGGSRPTAASGLAGPDGAGAREAAGAAAAVGLPLAPRTSSSVMRPPGPVPCTPRRSTPSSRASRRVEGVAATATPSAFAGAAMLCRDDAADGGEVGAFGTATGAAGALWRGAAGADGVAEAHERLAHLDRLPRLHVDLLHAAREGRGNLHLRLVRLHLQEGCILLDEIALLDEKRPDLGLHEPLAEIGQDERARHDPE